jgi:hypothetical protein
MTAFTPRSALAAGVAALALGCTAIAGQSGGASDAPLACAVEMTARGGMLTLEGVVSSDAALSGEYHLRVVRGGTRLNQGGPFDLPAGDTARLGRVTLNGPAAGLDVDLTLEVAGQTLRCPASL